MPPHARTPKPAPAPVVWTAAASLYAEGVRVARRPDTDQHIAAALVEHPTAQVVKTSIGIYRARDFYAARITALGGQVAARPLTAAERSAAAAAFAKAERKGKV